MNQHIAPTSVSSLTRDTRQSVARGWRKKCPSCGKGPLMHSYLKVRDNCAVCGEELFHHRADDGPAWATILVSGHVVAPLMLFVFERWQPEAWVMAVGFSTVFTLIALYMLPRIKGAFVGFQWAKRMHGFETSS